MPDTADIFVELHGKKGEKSTPLVAPCMCAGKQDIASGLERTEPARCTSKQGAISRLVWYSGAAEEYIARSSLLALRPFVLRNKGGRSEATGGKATSGRARSKLRLLLLLVQKFEPTNIQQQYDIDAMK